MKLAEMLRHGKEALPSGSFYGEAVGTWIKELALERAASAQAVGASAIITASPFDYRDLLGTMQVYDFVEIAAQKLS
jgi:hypothetical protein